MKSTFLILILMLAGIVANSQTEAVTMKKDAHPAASAQTAAPAADKTAPTSTRKDVKAEPPKADKTPPSTKPIQSQRKTAN